MKAKPPVNEELDPDRVATGERLKQLRKASGYGGHGQAKAFAAYLGVASNHYSMIEAGKRPLALDTAREAKRQFGATLDWLYDGDGQGLPDELRRRIHAAITET